MSAVTVLECDRVPLTTGASDPCCIEGAERMDLDVTMINEGGPVAVDLWIETAGDTGPWKPVWHRHFDTKHAPDNAQAFPTGSCTWRATSIARPPDFVRLRWSVHKYDHAPLALRLGAVGTTAP